MIFDGNAVISELWAHKIIFKKAKIQSVDGRGFHSLSFRLTGEVAFDAYGKKHISHSNCITFMPAGCSYKTEVLSDGEIMAVHFKTLKKYDDLKPTFFSIDDIDIKNTFMRLCDSYTADGAHGYKCMSLFYTLLDMLDRPAELLPKRMRLAKNHIDKNYAEPLCVTSLAYASGLSDVHFRNEFKKYFGLSPLAYIKKVRVDNACNLLRSGYYSVTDTALACGFDSISYFSYEFKRLVGITPTDYIKKYEKG